MRKWNFWTLVLVQLRFAEFNKRVDIERSLFVLLHQKKGFSLIGLVKTLFLVFFFPVFWGVLVVNHNGLASKFELVMIKVNFYTLILCIFYAETHCMILCYNRSLLASKF